MLLIIGKRSNLTSHIENSYLNSVSFSTDEIINNIDCLNKFRNENIVILFNNFQAANKLSDTENIEKFVNRSITSTAKVLDYIKNFKNIEKLIYTSSSSVYGDNKHCCEDDIPHPISLQASLKLSNEFFIKQYCNKHSIDYTILRVFNMYGGNDNFSIISKIIKSIKEKEILNLVNNGSGIRDFIHIDNVVEIILNILNIKSLPIINIGTGNKKSVKEIVDFLFSKNIEVNIKNIVNSNEIKVSIANIDKLKRIYKNDFIKVEEYILKELKIGVN
ncbi:NAD(P)-dependent oxidoreductase [Aliarcobacter butzleri]|uniref:NAD-dependent epimerase/dehydratase family protein n=1 Tax=Aliarcobacter butzleri TaxID=28197 RepID=UPI00344F2131